MVRLVSQIILFWVILPIAQFRYFKIQPKTIDMTVRLQGINSTNSIVYSPEPHAEVYRLRLNIVISNCVPSNRQLSNFAYGSNLLFEVLYGSQSFRLQVIVPTLNDLKNEVYPYVACC